MTCKQLNVNDLKCLFFISVKDAQTFPKNFIFNGNKTDLEQVIGNAVPVKLGEFVAKCINQYMVDKTSNRLQTMGQLELELEYV
ncbi:MAG: hypothetical protein EAZ32_00020 [Cytophagia bacterium]|nr:MAG: hypothetical protein EAZ38_02485 [Cytophagales bacterium]TAG43246.1 MAG: hypothetical protein EAZ32_00020 [Cytophagia bacterium]TAG76578.1 MAG: hypothetical protein EAZ22_17715 [Cytophagales bacterium]